MDELSPWLQEAISHFQKYGKKQRDLSFIDFLLDRARDQLPMEYSLNNVHPAEMQFPSSPEDRIEGWFAHRLGHVILSAAPHIERRTAFRDCQAFYELLASHRVGSILNLAYDHEYYSYTNGDELARAKQWANSPMSLRALGPQLRVAPYDIFPTEQSNILAIGSQDIERMEIRLTHLPTPDDEPQRFGYKESLCLLQFFKTADQCEQQDKTVLIHCSSGVGRAPTVYLLYRLHKHGEVSKLLDACLVNQSLSDDQIQGFVDILRQELFSLRRRRFAVASGEQGGEFFSQLLLLRAIELNKYEGNFNDLYKALYGKVSQEPCPCKGSEFDSSIDSAESDSTLSTSSHSGLFDYWTPDRSTQEESPANACRPCPSCACV